MPPKGTIKGTIKKGGAGLKTREQDEEKRSAEYRRGQNKKKNAVSQTAQRKRKTAALQDRLRLIDRFTARSLHYKSKKEGEAVPHPKCLHIGIIFFRKQGAIWQILRCHILLD